jgi:hypothetical protein
MLDAQLTLTTELLRATPPGDPQRATLLRRQTALRAELALLDHHARAADAAGSPWN